MKPQATSKEEILAAARKIVQEKGLSGISMRSVAAEAGVAAGTLYHYFPDKDALMLAVTADIWEDIFDLDGMKKEGEGFAAAVDALFCHAAEKISSYPGFAAVHGMEIASDGGPAAEGAACMHAFFGRIGACLEDVLAEDRRVRPDAFSTGLDEGGFVSFVLDNILLLLVLGKEDCSVFVAVIERVLY